MKKHERLQQAVAMFMDRQGGFKNASAVAKHIKEPPTSFLNCMNGIESFSERRARRFAEKLDVSAEWLITGKGAHDDHKLTEEIHALDDADKALVRRVIRDLRARHTGMRSNE